MDNNLWQRRSNNGKTPLATSLSTTGKDTSKIDSPRAFPSSKRFGNETPSYGKGNPFNTLGSANGGALASPSVGGSSAFSLGSGAFASFGSSKAPKTPSTETPNAITQERDSTKPIEIASKDAAADNASLNPSLHSTKYTWTVWYRPPTSKNADYEKSIAPLASFSSVEQFFAVYVKLKRPSSLPTVSDYHIFRKGVRPVWEDEENKRGGKWIMRLKKGVVDRYWEDLLLALVGDQFLDAGEEVTGAVLSVRNGEDVLSVWTRLDGGKNIRIRETIKSVLSLPSDTKLDFKSHDASIAQRTALDEARKEKAAGNGQPLKRRDTFSEDSAGIGLRG